MTIKKVIIIKERCTPKTTTVVNCCTGVAYSVTKCEGSDVTTCINYKIINDDCNNCITSGDCCDTECSNG